MTKRVAHGRRGNRPASVPARPRTLLLAMVCAAVMVVGGVALKLDPSAAAPPPREPSRSTPPAGVSSPPPVTAPAPTTTVAPIPRSSRVGPPPLVPVPAGQRPPQVVVVSFDGSGAAVDGTYPMYQFWRDVGRADRARMSFLLSGPYLLTHDQIGRYDAPQLGAARQGLGLAVSGALGLRGLSQSQAVSAQMVQLRDSVTEGHEIGTHFNGHICGQSRGSVARFSATDWAQELRQFDNMVDQANVNNGLNPPIDLGFTSKDVVGSRTPCLEGDFHALYPVLAQHGYLYDTSPTGAATDWPHRGAATTGPTPLWVFPLTGIPLYGTHRSMLSMDYNLCYDQDGCQIDRSYPAAQTASWRQQALDTYRQYFETSYGGNRAPVFLGNHFEMWHAGAYTDALAAFVHENCSKPEVECVTYKELALWLNQVPPDQQAAWQAGQFPHLLDLRPPAYGQPVPGALVPQPAVAVPGAGPGAASP